MCNFRKIVLTVLIFNLMLLCACDKKDTLKIPAEGVNKMTISRFFEITDVKKIEEYIDALKALDVHKTDDFFQESPNMYITFYYGDGTEFVDVTLNTDAIYCHYELDVNTGMLIRVTKGDRSSGEYEIQWDQYYWTEDYDKLADFLRSTVGEVWMK